MRNRIIFALISFLCIVSISKADSGTDLVTWSDFGKVRNVAASNQYAYFATTNGIIRYDITGGDWDEPLTGTVGVDQRDIQRIWVDQFDQHLYAQTTQGYFELNLFLGRWYSIGEMPHLDNPAQRVATSEFFFAPPGFTYTSAGEGILTNQRGVQFPISDVIDDGGGNLWIGIWGHGPATANSTSKVVEFLPYGLLQNRVNTIYTDEQERLWVSGALDVSSRSGISIFDGENNQFDYIESGALPELPAVDINCLAGVKDKVYAGTTDGLYLIEGAAHRVRRILSDAVGLRRTPNVLSIAANDTLLFAGTNDGFAIARLYDDSIHVALDQHLVGRIIYDLELVDSTLWIATDYGAYRLFLTNGKFQRFNDSQKMLNYEVYEIERNKDDLWFSCKDGAIRLNLATGDNEPFSVSNTDGGDRVLAVNDEVLAINTFRGVALLYYGEESSGRKDIIEADGLPSDRVYALKLVGDYLWIGGNNGLTRVAW